MEKTPFRKGQPIRFTGELSNAPWTGSGCVKLSAELVLPLVDYEDHVAHKGLIFWPMIRTDGSVRYFFEYVGYSCPHDRLFLEVE